MLLNVEFAEGDCTTVTLVGPPFTSGHIHVVKSVLLVRSFIADGPAMYVLLALSLQVYEPDPPAVAFHLTQTHSTHPFGMAWGRVRTIVPVLVDPLVKPAL